MPRPAAEPQPKMARPGISTKNTEKIHPEPKVGTTRKCPQNTVVAEMITELIRFEPEICICNAN